MDFEGGNIALFGAVEGGQQVEVGASNEDVFTLSGDEWEMEGVFGDVVFPDQDFEKLNDEVSKLLHQVNVVVQVAEMRLGDIGALLKIMTEVKEGLLIAKRNESAVEQLMPDLAEKVEVSLQDLIAVRNRRIEARLDVLLRGYFSGSLAYEERKESLREIGQIFRFDQIKFAEQREEFFSFLEEGIAEVVDLAQLLDGARPALPFFDSEADLEQAKEAMADLQVKVGETLGKLRELVDYEAYSEVAMMPDAVLKEKIQSEYADRYTLGVDESFWWND